MDTKTMNPQPAVKSVFFEVEVSVVDGPDLVNRALDVLLKSLDLSWPDIRLNRQPLRIFPDSDAKQLAEEFIESAKGDSPVKEVEMGYNPTNEEYDAAPDPEIKESPIPPAQTNEQGEVQ